jgi:hypothetical protein
LYSLGCYTRWRHWFWSIVRHFRCSNYRASCGRRKIGSLGQSWLWRNCCPCSVTNCRVCIGHWVTTRSDRLFFCPGICILSILSQRSSGVRLRQINDLTVKARASLRVCRHRCGCLLTFRRSCGFLCILCLRWGIPLLVWRNEVSDRSLLYIQQIV